jgi:uncharacterized protein (DUF58 family)
LQHPEQNSDVILFVDSAADVTLGANGTLACAGRAAAAMARAHIAARDRVGLIAFGGVLRWLAPGMGTRHLYRVLDTLLDTSVVASYTWPRLEVLPLRTLPLGALIVALTPLTDPRTVRTLVNLHGRGHEVVVIEIDPEPFTSVGVNPADVLTQRIWRLYRSARRHRIWELGIPLVQWDPSQPLDGAIAELNQLRQRSWRTLA